MIHELTKKCFLEDVMEHKTTILKDDGLYRHILLKNPINSYYYYEIITWPNALSITGDMGSFVFERTSDMFNFFRNDELKIHTDYWSSKCISESTEGNGIREFSEEIFKECVLSDTRKQLNLEEDELIPENIMEEIQPLLNCADEYECIEGIRNFTSELVKFDDFHHTLTKKTYHFVWCCYAIVFAIQQYDLIKGK